MSEQPYKRPPITEAVIDIRFSEDLPAAELEKVSRDFASVYANRETVKNVVAQIGVPPNLEAAPTTQFNQHIGYRLASTDVTELLVLWPATLIVSQLAPYPGWGAFFSRFERDWTRWKKAVGYRKIVRVGVRYINRIDVPVPPEGYIEESEYLNIYAKYPDIIGNVAGYFVQFRAPLNDIECDLVVNSGGVPSPLLNHMSIMFDQDIIMERICPQNDDDIYTLLKKIHEKKNGVFEASVTDRARELFQQ